MAYLTKWHALTFDNAKQTQKWLKSKGSSQNKKKNIYIYMRVYNTGKQKWDIDIQK